MRRAGVLTMQTVDDVKTIFIRLERLNRLGKGGLGE
jgi:hypothetical protein